MNEADVKRIVKEAMYEVEAERLTARFESAQIRTKALVARVNAENEAYYQWHMGKRAALRDLRA